MSTLDLRQALAGRYRYDEARRLFRPHRDKPFAYSDGSQSESYLAASIAGASDLGVGSPELARCIRDWPSQYHLSPARPNLLRPIARALGQRILEIGAGCGAITRFLGESGATVLAIEGSIERAAIAASRCRDLANVLVLCDNFEDVDLPFEFDLVTLIGVLEYSRMYGSGEDPVQAMLGLARKRLADTGTLALAIENQLGLKYLAGAPEDHAGEPFFGVSGLYGPKSPVTFGRTELQGRLERAGFGTTRFLYPFPDYKLPAVIVTEDGFREPSFGVADLIATSPAQRAGGDAGRAYSESLAREVFLRNGLGPATANSFLVLAGRAAASPLRETDGTVLAYAYSTGRERCYAKQTRFARDAQGVKVLRNPLFDTPPPENGSVVQRRVAEEPYVAGESLFRGLEALVARRGWTTQDLAQWAEPWLRLVRALAHPPGANSDGDPSDASPIDPGLFDCTPFNVVKRSGDGALVAFDLEWEAAGHGNLSLAQVAFRGLWNCLLRLEEVASPAADVSLDIASLASATLERLGIRAFVAQVHEWIRREREFTGAVSGIPQAGPPAPARLRVRGEREEQLALRVAQLERELESNRSRLVESLRQASGESGRNEALSARAGELQEALGRQQAQIERLDRTLGEVGHRFVSRAGRMLQPYPRIRAILRAPLNILWRIFGKPPA